MTGPVVTTTSGPVQGKTTNGVIAFLGLPYAAAPVGPLRFKEPLPHPGWTETRDATRHGPCAPQPAAGRFDKLDLEPLMGEGWKGGEEFLNLAVWTPEAAGSGRPVMVWIHGGAFVAGSNAAPVYDGSAFARDGAVCVSMNFRMGVEGFLPLPGVPTNLGMRDKIAALKWIQSNVAAFGGDPANVTVFGESSGAMSIADLVASPLAKGLFRRAIIQSGHGSMTRSVETNRKVVEWLARKLKIAPTLEGFNSVSMEATLKAVTAAQKPTSGLDLRGPDGREPAFGLSRFLPIHGDDVIPESPLAAVQKGAGAEVDILIGTTEEEMNIYLAPIGAQKWMWAGFARYILGKFEPKARQILEAYGLGKRGKKAGPIFVQTMTDMVFRLPARDFAAAHKGKTHFYEFDWKSPALEGELGACHALEIPFAFDTLACVSGPKGFVGENPPQILADRVHRIWVDFARDGSAPWPEYDGDTRQVYSLSKGAVAREAEMPAARFWP